MSTCSQGLTVAIFSPGPVKGYIDVQCIMARQYMHRGRTVKLSPTFGRSRGEYRRAIHWGYFVLVHLPTCPPGLTGKDVNIGLQDIMANRYIFLCQSLSSLFSSSVIIKAIYGVIILLWGVWGAGAVSCLFHCAVHDYSLTNLQRGDADIIGILFLNTCQPIYQN